MWMQQNLVAAFFVSLAAVLPSSAAQAHDVTATTVDQIRLAVAGAQAGDVITVAPGTYTLPLGLRMTVSGTAKRPIVFRAAKPGTVELRSAAVEFIKISAPYWTVENFDIAGTCSDDSNCEHAFHIVNRANHTVIRGNRIHDYNAHIKGNGEQGHFPNDVVIENNMLFDTRPRVTDNPIAPVDVVGGARWIMRNNLIADFAKRLDHPPARTDDWSYAMFLKGNSERGLIAGNIVGCIIDAPATPSIRGIALGGSGTGQQMGLCDKGDDCRTEHRQGTIWGNIVLNCPAEPGIYLFQSADTLVAGNIVAATAGIAAVAAETSGRITGNRLDGTIETRAGATMTIKDNTILSSEAAQQRYVLPLLGKVSPKPGSTLDRAAKLIAAYRAYRDALTKP
jgi:nitrous oxidase accessory protein NosD